MGEGPGGAPGKEAYETPWILYLPSVKIFVPCGRAMSPRY